MKGRKDPVGFSQVAIGSDYSDEERIFLRAMQDYKRERQRPFPTWREVLAVLKSLGYRKVAPPDLELPKP